MRDLTPESVSLEESCLIRVRIRCCGDGEDVSFGSGRRCYFETLVDAAPFHSKSCLDIDTQSTHATKDSILCQKYSKLKKFYTVLHQRHL